ncbi:LytR/AlgR family response regulator transcription factor [Virgibacillus sp. W0181]|uniref:LytR/AlgR family response regulator transcription factor n=1 Tax=Virgibacillus sp. W0181 TaxID=3391581 RepID=UPI003F452FE4
MKIKVMIAEDERLAREELAYFIQQEEDCILTPSAENGRQLLELYDQYNPDVIFLDIHMPQMSGTEAAQQIKKNSQDDKFDPLLIFTTAYDEYAVNAFEIGALKPYASDRFKEAMSRIRERLPNRRNKKQQSNKLLVDDGEKKVVVAPETIFYAVKSDRVTEIHTNHNIIQAKMTLQEMEEKLSGYPFFRSHRSFLVNVDKIHEIKPWFNGAYNLMLKDDKKSEIPLSRTSAKALFQMLQK